MENIWGSQVVVGDRTIDVHIRKLREKVGINFLRRLKGGLQICQTYQITRGLRIKNFRVAFWLSSILVAFLILLFYILFLVTDLQFETEIIMVFALILLLFFIFSVFLINFRIERFILNKIKGIYNDLSPSGVSMSQQIVQSDMEALRESVQKFADDKKLEIETLKEKEDYRKEFIGNISHELKTPLFTIQGYVLTLLEGAIKDKKVREKYLKRTAKGVDRLIYVVKDLDLITQFESGIKTIDRTYF